EHEDDESEDGPVDYPMDGGDDGDDGDPQQADQSLEAIQSTIGSCQLRV
ncbi:hypothetical protein Tco_0388215, partial [Tanacetum coccineum]